jgi:pilus assembly protein Flp/PilA
MERGLQGIVGKASRPGRGGAGCRRAGRAKFTQKASDSMNFVNFASKGGAMLKPIATLSGDDGRTRDGGRKLRYLKDLLRDARGATAIEYGLLAALISIALVAAFNNLGLSLVGIFEAIAAALRF